MSCSTSSLLAHISVFRNPAADAQSPNFAKVALAEIAYIVIVPYTIIEAAISQLVKAIAKCMSLDEAKYQKINAWAASSGHCSLWAIHCAFFNLFVTDLWATEKQFATSILRKNNNPNNPPPPPQPPAPADVIVPRTSVTDQAEQQDPIPRAEYNPPEADRDIPWIQIPVEDRVPTENPPPPVEDPIALPVVNDVMPDPDIAAIERMLRQKENPLTPAQPEPIDLDSPVEIEEPAFSGPIKPQAVEPTVAKLLKRYELADNAKKYTDVFEKICQDLPNPTLEELDALAVNIVCLVEDNYVKGQQPFNVMGDLQRIAYANTSRSTEDDHYVKMLMCVYNTIMEHKDSSEIEIMKSAIMDANVTCKTRRNEEIQRLFFSYAAPRLNISCLKAFTPTDSLIFELMQYRIKLRDQILNAIGCDDTHDHNHFYRKLNESTFYLPYPSLSVPELYERPDKEELLVNTFRSCYESTKTLFTVFTGLLYPRKGEKFKFKTEMFADWLKEKDLMNADAFEDEDMEKYKPQLVIDYLVDKGFLQAKGL